MDETVADVLIEGENAAETAKNKEEPMKIKRLNSLLLCLMLLFSLTPGYASSIKNDPHSVVKDKIMGFLSLLEKEDVLIISEDVKKEEKDGGVSFSVVPVEGIEMTSFIRGDKIISYGLALDIESEYIKDKAGTVSVCFYRAVTQLESNKLTPIIEFLTKSMKTDPVLGRRADVDKDGDRYTLVMTNAPLMMIHYIYPDFAPEDE